MQKLCGTNKYSLSYISMWMYVSWGIAAHNANYCTACSTSTQTVVRLRRVVLVSQDENYVRATHRINLAKKYSQ